MNGSVKAPLAVAAWAFASQQVPANQQALYDEMVRGLLTFGLGYLLVRCFCCLRLGRGVLVYYFQFSFFEIGLISGLRCLFGAFDCTLQLIDMDSTADEEVLRKALKPVDVTAQVADILQRGWGLVLVGEPRALESYDDRNYAVSARNGSSPEAELQRFVLKIHNGVESAQCDVLKAQDAAMRFLAKGGVNCPVPVDPVVTTDDGNGALFCQNLPVASGESPQLVVRLLSWVPGETMQSSIVCWRSS